MKDIFQNVQNDRVPSNTFDLSHDRKMSLDMGELIPILNMEIIPGDKINMSTSQLLRLAPMVSPVMHQINVFTHFFFVPNRLLWDNWEDFITGREDGTNTSVFPTINPGQVDPGDLSDYLGLPLTDVDITISAFPYAAYQFIFNEYYRDQNLRTPIEYKLVDGDYGYYHRSP